MARTKAEERDEPANSPAALEAMLGHHFGDPALLLQALTHSSWMYETAGPDSDAQDNETLEFLGDAVLGLVVAESLWKRFPARTEGELTQMRASVVSRRYLGQVGTRLALGRFLRLGPTAEANHARENAALFSNTVEALLAALYLDGGLRAARKFVERHLLAGVFADPAFRLQAAADDEPRPAPTAGAFPSALGDWKSALKERLDAESGGAPEYRLLAETGPAHQRSFRVEVWVGGQAMAEAEGSSKKRAQQEAARLALRRRDGLPDDLPEPEVAETPPPSRARQKGARANAEPATQRKVGSAQNRSAPDGTGNAASARKSAARRAGKRKAEAPTDQPLA